MRKALLLVGIPVSVVGLGLAAFIGLRASNEKPVDAFAEELKAAEVAGIELAQSQAANSFALSEIAPEAKPETEKVIKRGNGTRAVRSATPTVKAAPEAVAANVVEEIPDLSVIHTAAAPSDAEVVAPSIPEPVPASEPAPSEDSGSILRGGNGGGTRAGGNGAGAVLGGIFGAVIRGGGVHGDNCDPRTDGRRGNSRPVYGANPQAGGSGSGSTIRGGGIRLPVGVSSNPGSSTSRPRGGR